jgi:hypothetical protein
MLYRRVFLFIKNGGGGNGFRERKEVAENSSHLGGKIPKIRERDGSPSLRSFQFLGFCFQ